MLLTWLLSFSPLSAEAADGTETAGDVLRWLMPVAAWSSTVYLGDAEGRVQFYSSFFANLSATRALKVMVSKPRPNGEDRESFPSSHTSMAFQGAAFIHRRYGWKYSVPAYLGSAFVAWSRVDADYHDTADVVAGAIIGVASSFLIVRPYRDVVVSPVVSAGYYGVGVSGRW